MLGCGLFLCAAHFSERIFRSLSHIGIHKQDLWLSVIWKHLVYILWSQREEAPKIEDGLKKQRNFYMDINSLYFRAPVFWKRTWQVCWGPLRVSCTASRCLRCSHRYGHLSCPEIFHRKHPANSASLIAPKESQRLLSQKGWSSSFNGKRQKGAGLRRRQKIPPWSWEM